MFYWQKDDLKLISLNQCLGTVTIYSMCVDAQNSVVTHQVTFMQLFTSFWLEKKDKSLRLSELYIQVDRASLSLQLKRKTVNVSISQISNLWKVDF